MPARRRGVPCSDYGETVTAQALCRRGKTLWSGCRSWWAPQYVTAPHSPRQLGVAYVGTAIHETHAQLKHESRAWLCKVGKRYGMCRRRLDFAMGKGTALAILDAGY